VKMTDKEQALELYRTRVADPRASFDDPEDEQDWLGVLARARELLAPAPAISDEALALKLEQIREGQLHQPTSNNEDFLALARLAKSLCSAPSLTPDEAKVLEDIRAATPKGYKAVGFREFVKGDLYEAGGKAERAAFENSEFSWLILVPIAPEPKRCPRCNNPATSVGCVPGKVRCSGSACPLAVADWALDEWAALEYRLTLAPTKEAR
jgi:hypothetical protein